MSSGLFYYGTRDEVRLGDRIAVRRLLRSDLLATVVYIPGLSAKHPDIGTDQWAFMADDGSIYVNGYAPDQLQPPKGIRLVARAGSETEAVVRALKIPPEEEVPERWRDLFAVIGCCTVVILAVLVIAVIILRIVE